MTIEQLKQSLASLHTQIQGVFDSKDDNGRHQCLENAMGLIRAMEDDLKTTLELKPADGSFVFVDVSVVSMDEAFERLQNCPAPDATPEFTLLGVEANGKPLGDHIAAFPEHAVAAMALREQVKRQIEHEDKVH